MHTYINYISIYSNNHHPIYTILQHLRRLTYIAPINSLAICPIFGLSQGRAPAEHGREKKKVRVFIPWMPLYGVTSGHITLKVSFSKWPSWHDSRFLVTSPSLHPWVKDYIIPYISPCLHLCNCFFLQPYLDYFNSRMTSISCCNLIW